MPPQRRTTNRPATRRVAGSRRQQATPTPALAAPEVRAAGAAPPEELAPADTGPAPEAAEPQTVRATAKTRPTPGPLPRPRVTKVGKVPEKEPTERAPESAARARVNRLWFGAAVLLAIAVALGILSTGWLGSYRDAQAREQAWQQALPAAKENVARLFSYDYRHIQADRNSVAGLLTGQFRTDYLSSMDKLVIPQAPAKKFVLVSTTQSAGVSSVSPDGHQAVVIVFLNQAISNTDVKARTDLVRLRVTMTEVGGRWLISEVKSV
jgi:Mce-associated membrane protein